jgi:hypothetical protein
MPEVLVQFTERVRGEDGMAYLPRVWGGLADDGLWEGWIEFADESGATQRTRRETEQPHRDDLLYWAEGLTVAYLEGALGRALAPHEVTVPAHENARRVVAAADSSRPVAGRTPHAILDPFAAYSEGEELLRKQLRALSRDHLINIIKAYRLPDPGHHDTLAESELVDAIVSAVARANG